MYQVVKLKFEKVVLWEKVLCRRKSYCVVDFICCCGI